MKQYQVGDVVHGRNSNAEMPKGGGVVARIVGKDYYYINHIGGGGIGNRGGEELVLGGESK